MTFDHHGHPLTVLSPDQSKFPSHNKLQPKFKFTDPPPAPKEVKIEQEKKPAVEQLKEIIVEKVEKVLHEKQNEKPPE